MSINYDEVLKKRVAKYWVKTDPGYHVPYSPAMTDEEKILYEISLLPTAEEILRNASVQVMPKWGGNP